MKTPSEQSLIAAVLVSALVQMSVARAADVTPAEANAIAEEVFIYGLPA